MGGTGPQRRQRVGGGQPQIVVGVDLQLTAPVAPQRLDMGMGREGIQDAQGIGIAQSLDAQLVGLAGHQRQLLIAGPRGILAPQTDSQPQLLGPLHHGPESLGGRLPAQPQLVGQHLAGNRHRDIDPLDPESRRLLDLQP